MPSGPSCSATSPAAANTPAWRIPPPSSFRARRARWMNSASPTISDPTGQPSDFDRQNVADAPSGTRARAGTPSATDALNSRAPSTNRGTPRSAAMSATDWVNAAVRGWPIDREWVFSIVTSAVAGSWTSSERNASCSATRSNVPSSCHRIRARTLRPPRRARPPRPDDVDIGGGDDLAAPRDLGHDPDEVAHRPGRYEDRSLGAQELRGPRLQRVDGLTSPNTSSPTSARDIAAHMAGEGFVTVSERRSIIAPS